MTESSEHRDILLSRLADEFAARQRRGETIVLQDYCDRHPEVADDLRALFPAFLALEQGKDDAADEYHSDTNETPVSQMGDFRLLREVGRGGMGVVYEAEQISLGRRVAIKILPSAVFRDPSKRRRFEREARSAAKLHHTNIVPVHGFGEHDGVPYYVMQFISGSGLDTVIDELRRSTNGRDSTDSVDSADDRRAVSISLARSLVSDDPDFATTLTAIGPLTPVNPLSHPEHRSSSSLSTSGVHLPGQATSGISSSSDKRSTYWQSVARIGVQVALALSYAHKLGVLHRDIKPANLLLDLDGVVWVTDFGLAKAEDSDNLTQTGDLLGTLRYMPPEAFEGKSDSRSDLYSLGLSLFELMALRPAYEERERNKLVKRVTSGDVPELRKLCREAPRDLVTIVEKAIQRDPARRYASATAMAEDLQRFLDGRPITARRANELERLWMWAHRRPAIAALTAALFICLAGGAIVSTVFAVRANAFARQAQLREDDANFARDIANRNAEAAQEVRNVAARQAAMLLFDRAVDTARAGEPARALHMFAKALGTLPAGDPQSAPLERVIRANLAAWAETAPSLQQIWPSGNRSFAVCLSRDGEQIAMTVENGEIRSFETSTGQPRGQPIRREGKISEVIAFAPDGRTIWVCSSPLEKDPLHGSIEQFDVQTGERRQTISTAGPVSRLLCSADGQTLVASVLGLHRDDTGPGDDVDGSRKWCIASIAAWDTARGSMIRSVEVKNDDYRAFMDVSPNGQTVTAWYFRDRKFNGITFAVQGNETPKSSGPHTLGTLAELGTRYGCSPIHFRNDLSSAIVNEDGTLSRWSPTAGFGKGVSSPLNRMYLGSPADGRWLLSHSDGRIYDSGCWPPRPTGIKIEQPGWGQTSFDDAVFSPDGRFLTAGNALGETGRRLWQLPRPHSRPPATSAESMRQADRKNHFIVAAFDRQTRRVLLDGYSNPDVRKPLPENHRKAWIADLDSVAVRVTSIPHDMQTRDGAFTPDGRYFATASEDGTARVWDSATAKPAGPPLQHTNFVDAVSFSPDGNTLAAADYGPAGLIKFWDWRTGKETRPPLRHDDIVLSIATSPDGNHIVSIKDGSWSGKSELLIWNIPTGKIIFRTPHAYTGNRKQIAVHFSPDGHAVASLEVSGLLRLREVSTGRLLAERSLDGPGLFQFSPDGRIIAVSGKLGIRLFDAHTLAPRPGGLLPSTDALCDLAFSPDGAYLLTGHANGSAQLWDVVTRKPIGPPTSLIGPIRGVVFSRDNQTCIAVAADGTIRRWPVPTPLAEPDLGRLNDRIALMTGQRMDDSFGMDFIPILEWQGLRTRLVGQGRTALVPLMPDACWHDIMAADAEQDGDPAAALWHLEKLGSLKPDDWQVAARKYRMLILAGQHEQATKAKLELTRLAPTPQHASDWLQFLDEAAAFEKPVVQGR